MTGSEKSGRSSFGISGGCEESGESPASEDEELAARRLCRTEVWSGETISGAPLLPQKRAANPPVRNCRNQVCLRTGSSVRAERNSANRGALRASRKIVRRACCTNRPAVLKNRNRRRWGRACSSSAGPGQALSARSACGPSAPPGEAMPHWPPISRTATLPRKAHS